MGNALQNAYRYFACFREAHFGMKPTPCQQKSIKTRKSDDKKAVIFQNSLLHMTA